MATNRFTRQLAAILRETADMGAQSWRNQVSEAGWVPRPELAAPVFLLSPPCAGAHRPLRLRRRGGRPLLLRL